ncbi:hypothetical protein ABKA04_009902 [Annulohypoxylon sp. FPYF3050]
MLLGDRNRVIFTAACLKEGQQSLVAGITEVRLDSQVLHLNKGAASGIAVGDKFKIYHPSSFCLGTFITERTESTSAAEATIVTVSGLKSVAQYNTSKSEIQTGWFAKLWTRKKRAKVFIDVLRGRSNDIIDQLRTDWTKHVDEEFPLELVFNDNSFHGSQGHLECQLDQDFDIVVKLTKHSALQFLDKDRKPMPHITTLWSNRPESSAEMMKLLKHLCSYQSLASLSSDQPARTEPAKRKFEFWIDEVSADPKKQASRSSWKVHFKNTHSRTLYLTIMNLTPAYGVFQLFPSFTQSTSSRAVEPDTKIPPLEFDIVIPDSLKMVVGPGFSMQDTIKIFVSTEQTSFFNYLLPDLEKPVPPPSCTGETPQTVYDDSNTQAGNGGDDDDDDDDDDHFGDDSSSYEWHQPYWKEERHAKVKEEDNFIGWQTKQQSIITTVLQSVTRE